MSASPQQNVHSIEAVLEQHLNRIDQLDAWLHETRDEVRSTLYAMRLAVDPEFQQQVDELEAAVRSGTAPEPLNPDEFASRYAK